MNLRMGVMLACIGLAACGTRPGETGGLFHESVGVVALYHEDGRPVSHDERPTYHGGPGLAPKTILPDTLNVLALSGGGSHGAFGAGLLNGWTQSGKRPQFDVVTGISTGALMAPFAFIGPVEDRVLEEIYTTTDNSAVFQSRGIRGLLGDSLLDSTPLRMQVDRLVTDDFLKQVALQQARGRRLYIGTTNLDTSELVVWDMGGIAASDFQHKRELFISIMHASASVPGIFAPVFLRGEGDETPSMHVDGGVTAPLLFRSFMVQGRQKHKNVYLIVNGHFRLREDDEDVNPNLASIAGKSIGELLRGLLEKTVYQAYVTSRHSHADFNLAFIPDEEDAPANALHFDPQKMRELYEIGRQIGHGDTHWLKEPPRLSGLERVSGR